MALRIRLRITHVKSSHTTTSSALLDEIRPLEDRVNIKFIISEQMSFLQQQQQQHIYLSKGNNKYKILYCFIMYVKI